MAAAHACAHLDQVRHVAPAGEVTGCPQCIAAGEHWSWCYPDELLFRLDTG